MATAMKLPELGEGIESAEVVGILVAVGDPISHDQPVLEVETDKATAEVPAGIAGVVKAIHVKKGDQIKVGQLLLTVDDGAAASSAAPSPAAAARPAAKQTPVSAGPTGPAAAPAQAPASTPTAAPVRAAGVPAAASPAVRRLARELGIDIDQVRGSGPAGRISDDDLKLFTKEIMGRVTSSMPAAPQAPRLPDPAQWGEVERQPLSGIRKATAAAMAVSWSTIPHVTQHDRADITALEAFRRQQGPRPGEKRAKLTVTAVMVKLAAAALRTFPRFNSCLDLERHEMIYRKYINIGVAVDTERGLLVPVLRGVESMSLLQVAEALSGLAEKARNRKASRDDLSGGGFTITNLGGLGTTTFSPIVNWPEVAILGLGRARLEAVHVDGAFQPRLILPLSLSYDHRAIDGAEAARFLRWLAEAAEYPLRTVLES